MWQSVANYQELKNKKMLRVEHENVGVLLTCVGEEVYAIADKCPHLGASLSKGTLDNGIVTCASHHAQIDVKTGDIVGKPKILFMQVPIKKAKTFPAKIEDGQVLVDL